MEGSTTKIENLCVTAPNLVNISNNTSWDLKSEENRKFIRLNVSTPDVVKNNYILEAFALDLLSIIRGKPNKSKIVGDVWIRVIEAMINEQGFHIGFLSQIWCLTRIDGFKEALQYVCRKRLSLWKKINGDGKLTRFYETVEPNVKKPFLELLESNLDFERKVFKTNKMYHSPIEMIQLIHAATNGNGLNVLDEVPYQEPHQYGFGPILYTTFSNPLDAASYSMNKFSPYWIDMRALKQDKAMAMVPVWMLGWFDWNDVSLHRKIMSRNADGWEELMKRNPFKDYLLISDETNYIIEAMCEEIRRDSYCMFNMISYDLSGPIIKECDQFNVIPKLTEISADIISDIMCLALVDE